jgi:hypothetical protein
VKPEKITPPGRPFPTPVKERAAALAMRGDEGVVSGYVVTYAPNASSRFKMFGVDLPHKQFHLPGSRAVSVCESAAVPLPLRVEHEAGDVGAVTALWADELGLYMVGKLNLSDSRAVEAWKSYKRGGPPGGLGFSIGGSTTVLGPIEGAPDMVAVDYALNEISLTREPSDRAAVPRAPIVPGPRHAYLLSKALDPEAAYSAVWLDESYEGSRPVHRAWAVDAKTGKQLIVGWFYAESAWTVEHAKMEYPGHRDGGARFFVAGEKRPMLTACA